MELEIISKVSLGDRVAGYECKDNKGEVVYLDDKDIERYIEAGLIKNGVKIGGNVEVIDISTNHGKAKKYMQKCELMGIKVLEVDYLDDDRVELISVVNKENTGEITIPSFITDIRRKFDGDSCIEYGPLIECKYSKVIVEADNLDNLNSLCSWMQSERIELVIKNGGRLKSLKELFAKCEYVKEIDLSYDMDTSKVTNMGYMFLGCRRLRGIDISGIKTDSLENIDGMFEWCKSLESIDISKFNTSNVKSLSHLFADCESLEYVDLSELDLRLIKHMSCMFSDCYKLKSVKFGELVPWNLKWVNHMFDGCKNLVEIEGIDKISMRYVEDAKYMFACCFKLKDIKIDKYLVWLKDGSYMFAYCKSLKRVELKGGREVNDISGMFSGCKELEYLDISNFDVSNANTRYIIDDCDRLKEFKKPIGGIN